MELVEVTPGLYRAGRFEVRGEEGFDRLKIGFYMRCCAQPWHNGQTQVVSRWRSGYRLRVETEYSSRELEVLLLSLPGGKFEIGVRRWFFFSSTRLWCASAPSSNAR